jgi:hypothetical protein
MDILGQLLHLLSGIALICGAIFILASLLSFKGPDGYIKGILLLLLAGWIAHPHF